MHNKCSVCGIEVIGEGLMTFAHARVCLDHWDGHVCERVQRVDFSNEVVAATYRDGCGWCDNPVGAYQFPNDDTLLLCGRCVKGY